MNVSFTKAVGTSSNQAIAGKSVAPSRPAFRKPQRAACMRIKSATTVTANSSVADAQKWIDNFRSKSGGVDNVASAHKWIASWRATQTAAAPAPAGAPSSADIALDIAARVTERSAWIAKHHAKTPASAAPEPTAEFMSPADIKFDIAVRMSERSSWIAKWRTQQAAQKRSETWSAPLLSTEQERQALQRQTQMDTPDGHPRWLQMAAKAEGIAAPEGTAENWGCTDTDAANYDPTKVYDDGSCLFVF